jgi:hypothetical protein
VKKRATRPKNVSYGCRSSRGDEILSPNFGETFVRVEVRKAAALVAMIAKNTCDVV